MAVYQLTFTPQGPYFFGNEKTFSFVGEPAQYGALHYIRGERLPAQSTVFGALRYLLLPEKAFARAAQSAQLIGSESFRMGAEGQSFGAIKGVSPHLPRQGWGAVHSGPPGSQRGAGSILIGKGELDAPTPRQQNARTAGFNCVIGG